MNSGLIQQLKNIVALKDIPDEHVKWILERSEYKEFKDGDILTRTGQPIYYLWLISEGKGKFYLDVNGKLVHYYTFENNDETGGVGGTLPYSRMVNAPGYTYAEGQFNVFLLHKKYFAELEKLNPQLVQRLIGYMTERARSFATLKLQYEKVNALGRIAAGIAHELNNPSAAISRIASELSGIIKENYGLSQKLLALNVNPEIIQRIIDKTNEYSSEEKVKLSAIQKIDMEDEITQWLVNNGIPEGIDDSGIFVESGFSKEELQNVLDYTGKDSFVTVVRWLENYLTSLRIVKDLANSSSRISNLVSAIKNHVRMDRTNEMEKSNIHNDIEDSLTLLGHKIRQKNINVKKNFCSNMREVQAYIGELNQVWTNLIDNAIYAVDKNGTLIIETICDKSHIAVHITDDGHGIPAENLSRIFDPFFTTRGLSEGTGIGLDLVKRIVKKHNGEVKVESVPGRTVFTVKIPCK